MKPNTFSNGIRDLRERGDVGFEKILGVGSQWATHVYYQDFADAEQLVACKAVLIDRQRLLRPHLLKAAGERYARAVLKRVFGGAISSVPQTRRLGYGELDPTERSADLTFVYREGRTPIRCIVEVKNHREHLHSSKAHIVGKLIRQAIKTDSLPIFMASHISPDLLRICRATGVVAHSFGRQFIRSEDRAETKRLFPQMWQGQFQFVRLDRVFAVEKNIDERSREDFRILRDPAWLSNQHRQWMKMSPRMLEICDALLCNDREMLKALVPNV